MTKDQLIQKRIPDSPGVYFFLGKQKEILYIGKATSLKNRITSYFAEDIQSKRSQVIEQMVHDAKNVEWTTTDSVIEALILETNLIRTHKPRFNTRSKDDKSYNHLIITKEVFPRVLVVRGKDVTEQFTDKEIQSHFGPFPNGQMLREALKIVRRLFQYYDTDKPVGSERTKMARGKIDFNRQIGLYPDSHSKREYKKTIRHIMLFFEGKKEKIVRELEKEMHVYAKEEKFEHAERIKRQIFSLKHIQDIALIKDDMRTYRDEKTARIEAYDVAHLSGQDMVGVMTVLEAGVPQKDQYRRFKITSVERANDTGALKEVLTRRFQHAEWTLPHVLVVDGGVAQKNVAERIIKKNGFVIPVVAVVKDDRHRPLRIIAPKKLLETYEQAILFANAEAHRFAVAYHTQKRRKRSLS